MKPPPVTLPDTDDPYVLLDVRPGASVEQIRRAYLRKVKVWKPDRHPAEFRRIREAYDRLREQERWFDAWRQAGEVVRRAAEEQAEADGEAAGQGSGEAGRASTEGEAAASGAEAGGASNEAGGERARADARAEAGGAANEAGGERAADDVRADAELTPEQARAEVERALDDDALEGLLDERPDEEEDEDVESVIAALELELQEHREGDDDRATDDADEADADDGDEADADAPPDDPRDDLAAERRRRTARAAAVSERLAALEQSVLTALEAGRFAEAADRLLEPGTEAVAARREFAPLLLEVCCAVVWELPPRFAALVARYGDLVANHDTVHHDGALLHRRILVEELPAWRQAVADWPELHRFMVLGSSLRAPAEAELGLRLGRRAAADPTGLLQVLARAAQTAPGITSLYVSMAERWARSYGRLPLHRPTRARPTVEQAAAALADVAQRHRRVRWEQARPLLVLLAMTLVLLFAPTLVTELVVIGFVIVLWAWRAWARPTEARIYEQVVRPAAAAWLWSTQATPEKLAAALLERLPPRGTWGAVLHPGDLDEYPARLRDDLALLAFGVTYPMIPRLRTPGPGDAPPR